MDEQQAYHYSFNTRNFQMVHNSNSDPSIPHANLQHQQGQSYSAPILAQPNAAAFDFSQNHQSRAPPMRLDLPPPPVFATEPSPSNEYPSQYGPSRLIFSPLDVNAPNNVLLPNSMSSQHQQGYPPSGYAGSLPTSPYPTYATSGQAYLQQQQQQMPHQVQQSESYPPHGHQPQLSPYYSHPGVTTVSSNESGEHMTEYFPPYTQAAPQVPQHYQQPQQDQVYQQEQVSQEDQAYQQEQRYHRQGQQEYLQPIQQQSPQRQFFISPPMPSPTWQHGPRSTSKPAPTRPGLAPAGDSSQSAGSGGTSGPKTNRQQFTACGACRHRRVKCDLKSKQEEAGLLEAEERARRGPGPVRTIPESKKDLIVCTNCKDRHMKCVDEYAPMKAAKQLRRGKRISEVEVKYGKDAVELATSGSPIDERGPAKALLPELTAEFFESAFFRRFQVQRPILDPTDFVGRYLSYAEPCAANLGPEGALLCHVLYAWATSYGVDEHGRLDIPEGGGSPLNNLSLLDPGKDEVKREADRQARFEKMKIAVGVILHEIDACGILRKPTWDGVRVLLLLLPLTEGISTPVERLAMYESALSQVFMLCSHGALGYDGKAAGTSGVNGGSDQGSGRDINIVRIRTYWYAFVHEGITTGLKGGRLLLDGDDLETIQDSISNRTLVSASQNFRSVSKMAVAPINLALACRLINRALTGPVAKRRNAVNAAHVKEAWEALEGCWEEFESIRDMSPGQYASGDEIIRFVDGWKIFLFEAQNVIRTNLEDRLARLTNTQVTASIADPNAMPQHDALDSQILNVMHLLEIAKSKCDIQTRQIMIIIRTHLGTRFFEWDASLVRDGTFFAAMLLAKNNGSDDDIACCVQALNELRWAHAKAWERSADLRREWSIRSAHSSTEQSIMGMDGQSQTLLHALQTMTANPPAHLAGMNHNRTDPIAGSLNRSQGTDSSLSNSPYTSSPSIISPVYDPAIGPPIPYGQHAGAHQSQGHVAQHNGTYWTTSSSMPLPNNVSQVDYGRQGFGAQSFPPPSLRQQHHYQGATQQEYQQTQDPSYISQPLQGQVHGQENGPTGRYIFQPDGSQIYIPYNQG